MGGVLGLPQPFRAGAVAALPAVTALFAHYLDK